MNITLFYIQKHQQKEYNYSIYKIIMKFVEFSYVFLYSFVNGDLLTC